MCLERTWNRELSTTEAGARMVASVVMILLSTLPMTSGAPFPYSTVNFLWDIFLYPKPGASYGCFEQQSVFDVMDTTTHVPIFALGAK